MRVKLVSDYRYVGGVWFHVANLTNALINSGVDARIITKESPFVCDAELKVAKSVDSNFSDSLSHLIEIDKPENDGIQQGLLNGDLLHLHATISFRDLVAKYATIAADKQVPYVVTIHTSSTYRVNAEDTTTAEAKLRQALIKANRIIAVSKGVEEAIMQYGIAKDNIKVIPNGVDMRAFTPAEKIHSRTRLGLPLDKKIALFVGRLIYEKGADLLEGLARANKNICFTVLGYGPLESALSAKNITILGFLPRQNLPLLYSAADVFVLPSRTEGMPLVILESLACGTPVVASNIPGNNEIIDSAVGRLSDLSVRGLSDKIQEVLVENCSEKLSKNARLVAEKYSWDIIAIRTKEVYEKCLAN